MLPPDYNDVKPRDAVQTHIIYPLYIDDIPFWPGSHKGQGTKTGLSTGQVMCVGLP